VLFEHFLTQRKLYFLFLEAAWKSVAADATLPDATRDFIQTALIREAVVASIVPGWVAALIGF
jgi:hypothetical protein